MIMYSGDGADGDIPKTPHDPFSGRADSYKEMIEKLKAGDQSRGGAPISGVKDEVTPHGKEALHDRYFAELAESSRRTTRRANKRPNGEGWLEL